MSLPSKTARRGHRPCARLFVQRVNRVAILVANVDDGASLPMPVSVAPSSTSRLLFRHRRHRLCRRCRWPLRRRSPSARRSSTLVVLIRRAPSEIPPMSLRGVASHDASGRLTASSQPSPPHALHPPPLTSSSREQPDPASVRGSTARSSYVMQPSDAMARLAMTATAYRTRLNRADPEVIPALPSA